MRQCHLVCVLFPRASCHEFCVHFISFQLHTTKPPEVLRFATPTQPSPPSLGEVPQYTKLNMPSSNKENESPSPQQHWGRSLQAPPSLNELTQYITRDMSSSKKQSKFAIPQVHWVRSLKTTICPFLAIPSEIRAMIYVEVFSHESPRQRHRKPMTIHERSSTLASKIRLLQTNKSIRTEAAPVLYKCHTFYIKVPARFVVSWSAKAGRLYNGNQVHPLHAPLHGLAPYGRLITRIELGDPAVVWKNTWNMMIAPEISRLMAYPNLRFLRLHAEPAESSLTCVPLRLEIWNQLLARLDELELVVKHCGDEAISFREAIAPGPCWVQKTSPVEVLDVPRGLCPFKKILESVWSLRRTSMPKHSVLPN